MPAAIGIGCAASSCDICDGASGLGRFAIDIGCFQLTCKCFDVSGGGRLSQMSSLSLLICTSTIKRCDMIWRCVEYGPEPAPNEGVELTHRLLRGRRTTKRLVGISFGEVEESGVFRRLR